MFTSSRTTETHAQVIGISPLGQMLTARELLRRPAVTYYQVAHLAELVTGNGVGDGAENRVENRARDGEDGVGEGENRDGEGENRVGASPTPTMGGDQPGILL